MTLPPDAMVTPHCASMLKRTFICSRVCVYVYKDAKQVNQTNRRLYDDDGSISGNRSNGVKMSTGPSISTPSQALLVVMEQPCPIHRLGYKRRIRDLIVQVKTSE